MAQWEQVIYDRKPYNFCASAFSGTMGSNKHFQDKHIDTPPPPSIECIVIEQIFIFKAGGGEGEINNLYL
jgi:hypothetical protein